MDVELAFHWEVSSDVDEAFQWYEQQCTGLGDEFLLALEEAYERIRRNP